jgi:hypothetical protein
MCQPKDKGGKRCFRHAVLSMFSVRVTKVKTGADEKLVVSTLSELNKEGKNLPMPAPEEVAGWLAKKQFATSYDPDLDTHERKIQLNQLDRAKREVEQGVTGGQFHAWKNVTKEVRNKLVQRAAIVGIAGSIAFGAAGCGVQANNVDTTPKPTTSTSAPADPSASPSTPADSALGGDIVVMTKDGKTVVVKDQYGSYEKVGLNPNDELNKKVDPAIVDPTVKAAGWNDADVLDGQKFISNFVASEAIDSTALDSGDAGYKDWVSKNQNKYVAPELQANVQGANGEAGIVNNQLGSKLQLRYARDGKPRVSASEITMSRIVNVDQNGDHNLIFVGKYNATYRASNKDVLAAYEAAGYKKDQVLETLPSLKDEKGYVSVQGTMDYQYAIAKKDGNWKITGLTNTFNNKIEK